MCILIVMNDDSRIGYANQVYTKQLISVLIEPLYNAIMDIYRREAHMVQNKNNILIEFQKRLKDIPNWNQNIINEHVQKASYNCGFLDDLLSAVYFSNVKILSSVKIKKSKKKVHIKLPELDNFIHQTMIESARKIYSNPSLFSIKIYGDDMYNKEVVLPIIHESIQEAIVKSLPFQNILQTYFGNKLHGDESSEDDSSESDVESNAADSDNEEERNEEINNEEELTQQQQPQNNGFFDRQDEPPEVKEVPIQQNLNKNNPLQKQNPVFFPDAADDPIEEKEEEQ